MSQIQFKAFDLNLFKVLQALLETRSVTLAANQLALTPSAVSHALNRLRAALDDPLFERRGGLLQPTPYALEAGRRAGPALQQLEQALARHAFDPATAEREFVIAAGAYSTAVILPRVIERVLASAPKVRLKVMRIETHYADDVERRRVDLAFGVKSAASKRLEWEPLEAEEMVWVARRGHPDIRAPLTEAMLARASHVVVASFAQVLTEEFEEVRRFIDESAELRSAYDAAMGSERAVNRAVVVPDIANALEIVRRTDCVTLTMRRFAEAMSAGSLQVLTPPHRTPPVELGLIYHRARAADPGFQWLLQMMRNA